VPLRLQLEQRFGVPVVVENDANATLVAALERHDIGGSETVSLLFALGTGVGGAVAVGRQVLRGSSGYAGELGHIPIGPPGGVACVCGSSGCLELLAGGLSVARRAREAALAGEAAGLLAMSGKAPEALTAVDLVLAARQGEPFSLGLLESVGDAIGQAITVLVPAIDPAVVFISGSFGHAAADLIIPAIERRASRHRVYQDARPLPAITPDNLGPDAAAIGAALLARRHLDRNGSAEPNPFGGSR